MENRRQQNNKTGELFIKFSDNLKKGLLITAGSISLVSGILGIFIPVLPTTPFLLLTAFCYARSSEKFYNMLLNNKYLGNYIKNYREHKAIPIKTKISSIIILWITILFSAFYFMENTLIRIILIIVAVSVTVHLLSMNTLEK